MVIESCQSAQCWKQCERHIPNPEEQARRSMISGESEELMKMKMEESLVSKNTDSREEYVEQTLVRAACFYFETRTEM